MTLPNPICWLMTLWYTLKTGVWLHGAKVLGCDLREEEHLSDCIVSTSKCARCGKYEIAWERTARSKEVTR